MSEQTVEALTPAGIVEPTAEQQREANAKKFFDQVTAELAKIKGVPKSKTEDYFLAIQAANLGIAHDPVIRSKPVGIAEEVFQEDIIPFLPNSHIRWYVQVSTSAPIISLRTKFGENIQVDGFIFDASPFTSGAPRTFDTLVSRSRKYNLFSDIATVIDLAFAVEFRIGL